MGIRRNFVTPRNTEELVEEAKRRDDEYRRLHESAFIDAEEKKEMGELQEEIDPDVITDLRTSIREIVCNIDDPYLLDDILGYARYLVRRFVDHEVLGSFQGLGVDFEIVEPEVEEAEAE
jgi:hypothetical protein